LQGRLRRATRAGLAGKLSQLEGSAKLMRSLSYHAALKRGFALLRDSAGRSIRSVSTVGLGQALDIELADGHFGARAQRIGGAQTAPVARPLTRPKARPKSRDSGGQGSLF